MRPDTIDFVWPLFFAFLHIDSNGHCVLCSIVIDLSSHFLVQTDFGVK